MTVTATSLGARTRPRTSRGRFLRRRSTASAVPILCPYLVAESGAWRSSRPSRDHRCDAVTPAAPLALDKQRRLCLAKAYSTCATHLAAIGEVTGRDPDSLESASDGPSTASRGGATRWSLVRTAPVVLDDPGGRVPGGGGRRRLGQWALAGLMALALVAVVLARLPEATPGPSGSPAVLGATGQPAAAGPAGATPSRRAVVVATPSPSATAPATPSRSPRPSPSLTTAAPSPSGPSVYVVAAGDTLYAIARAHGTTVEAIQSANGLGASTNLQVGQELELP